MHGLHGLSGASAADPGALQTSTQALVYAAGLEPLPAAGVNPLPPQSPANMARWAPDIRALLLQSVFAAKLGWAMNPAGTQASVNWGGTPIWQVNRPTPATMATQVGLVRNYIDQRPDRSGEIMSQLGPFGAFFGIILGLTAARNAKTFELLGHVQSLAGLATMMPKHLLACRRPDEVDARILPLIQTPGHGAYPSAHAAQAFAMAEVLTSLIRANPAFFADTEKRVDLLYRQAHRIAVNRTVAGVHFPMDSTAGARLGVQIGRALVEMMTGKKALRPVAPFDPNTTPGADFLFADFAAAAINLPPIPPGITPADPLFGWLWAGAMAEFGGLSGDGA